jgi:hypothetical protein
MILCIRLLGRYLSKVKNYSGGFQNSSHAKKEKPPEESGGLKV